MVAESKRKGFSLFTPLIGTTVVVISILVSTMVLQNDIKISRAISFSFQQYDKELDAQLIRASASIHLLNSLRGFEENYTEGKYFSGGTVKIECSNKLSCKNKLEANFKTKLEEYGKTSLFSGLLNSIEAISGYNYVSVYCPIAGSSIDSSNCIADAVISATSLFDVKEDGDYFLIKFDVKNSNPATLEKIRNSFVVNFVKDYEEIGISVIPYSFNYKTLNKFNKTFDEMATLQDNFVKRKSGMGSCNGRTNEYCLDTLASPAEFSHVSFLKNDTTGDIETCFNFNKGLTICLEQSDAVSYSEKCKYNPTQIFNQFNGLNCL